MYWRSGTGFVTLWIAALTLAMSAVAALVLAASPGGALAFLLTAITLAPPSQEWLGHVRHKLAPAKAAFFAVITLLPVGLLCLAFDGVAALEREAKRQGFASAGQLARARDLALATPKALADHDEKQRKAAREKRCTEHRGSPPLECFAPDHARAALAFAGIGLAPTALAAVVRDALARQRRTWLARDRECAPILDRIDEAALPQMLASQPHALALAAALWARRLSQADLEALAKRSRAGAVHANRPGDPLDTRLAAMVPAVEKELEQALQAWSREIVTSEPSWRAFLNGRTPITVCKLALEAQ